ncbi:MAG: hypothetical protein J7647_16360 [Cyanobacteria bacterium SBLK]|nr:hypothetical protein [Cyanobacteria bacterium SBLK]
MNKDVENLKVIFMENAKVILENPEDREILNSILSEYSEKMNNLCGKIEEQQRERNQSIFVWILIFIWFTYTTIFSPDSLSKTLVFFSWETVYFAMIIGFILNLYGSISKTAKRLKSLKRDAKISAIKLEKVLRAVSQIHDHSINQRFVVRLELEVRLADAESVLRYYEAITKSDRKAQYKELRGQESELHRLTRELASFARIQRETATLEQNQRLIERYNKICDLLDNLNQELEQEPQTFFSGMIQQTWRKII